MFFYKEEKLNIIQYFFKGFLHYCNLLFNMFDFKDAGFMWIIILGMLLFIFINKEIRRLFLDIIKSLIGVIKTPPGIFFLILFLIYYTYITIVFEKKISIIILVTSLYLLAQDYIKINMSLLLETEHSVIKIIFDISLSAILLCFQQIVAMAEINDFSNLIAVLYSLLIIPVFSFVYFLFKHFCIYSDFYKINQKYIPYNDFEFFKFFNYTLLKTKNYKTTAELLTRILLQNVSFDFKTFKICLITELSHIKSKELNNKKTVKIKVKKNKIVMFFFYVWIANIIFLTIYIIDKRFNNTGYNYLYYHTYIIILIYFWVDLMKFKKIENQYDFVLYGLIYIILIILLIIFSTTLKEFRLSELGFMIPIFIFTKCITYKKSFPDFLNLPFLSENNFFGLDPKKYNTKR